MTATGLLLTSMLLLDGGAADAPPAADGSDGAVTVDAGDGGATALDAPGAGAPPAKAPVEPSSGARPAAPRTGRLTGRVLAKGSRKAVAGAFLVVDVAEVGATNARGEFSADVPCGRRRLAVQAAGFEPSSTVVDACADPPEALVLRLVPSEDGRSYETVVRSQPEQPSLRLTDRELRQTPGTLGDPLRAIESLPGVASAAWPAPVYAVRGSNPGNTGFFLDGVRMPALFHMALGPSVIHPYFLQGLEFFPGGYPARFGRYAAGIVSAETRPGETDAAHASIDLRLFDAGAMMTAPLAGGAVAVAGRYSYTGTLVSLLSEDVRLSYWDYQLRADRRVGPVQLTLLALGSGDVLAAKGNSVRELALGFHRLCLRAALPVAGGRLQGSIALGADHSRAPVADTYPIVVDARSFAPRLSFLRNFGPADVAVGFDGEVARYEPVLIGPLLVTKEWDLARRRNAYLLAGYASTTLRLGRRLTLTPELRYDSYAVSGAHASDLAPRLSARIALRDDTAIRIAGGHFSQMPSLPLQIPGAEAFGLQLLGLQTSWQASLGVETTAVAGAQLAVTGYFQRYQLTDLRDPSLAELSTVASDLLARREAVAYGVEVMARRPAATHRLHGWLSYTLSNSIRSYGGGAVGPSDWDQRHVLNLVAGYRAGRNTFGARFHVNTGRPIVTNAGVRRLPTFYQLDLRADRVVYYDRLTLNLYAELVNATATEDVYGYHQTTSGQIEQSSFRIVLPSVGVRGEF